MGSYTLFLDASKNAFINPYRVCLRLIVDIFDNIIYFQGLPSTIGLSTLIEELASEDCVVAKVLKHCGAIPFVKTNGPQTLLSYVKIITTH